MPFGSIRSRYIARNNIYVFTVWTAFLALLLVGVVLWRGVQPSSLPQSSAITSDGNQRPGGGYVGTVITKSSRQSECMEYKFDNGTGVFTQTGAIGCLDDVVPSRPQSAEELRFRSVKKAFGGAVR